MLLAATLLLPALAPAVTLQELRDDTNEGREFVHREVNGRALRLWVFGPAGHKATDRRAALVGIHGGGWSTPGPVYFKPLCRYFAGRGMVAVNIEYRLLPSKERPETGATHLGELVGDAQAAVRYVRAHAAELGIDPDRIAVAGDSAGGHLAASTGMLPAAEDADVSCRPNAMILYNPVVGLSQIHWTRGHKGLPPGEGKTVEARAAEVDPTEHVRLGLPPTLLIHGELDQCVPVEQADRFADAMGKAGNRCDYRRMAGWTHAFVIPDYGTEETIVEAMRMTDGFLRSLGYLAGEPTMQLEPRMDANRRE